MADYENGKIPASILRRVSNFLPLTSRVNSNVGSDLIREDAWAALTMLQVAFQAHFGRPLYVSEAYRGLTLQTAYYRDYLAGIGNLAAYPGTSNHGWAVSADFGSGASIFGSAAKVWLDQNGPAYGWHPTGNGFSRPEAWHYDYKPGTASVVIPAAGSITPIDPTSPTTPAEQDDDMPLLERFKVTGDPTGTLYLAENRMTYRPVAANESDAVLDMLRRLRQSEEVLTTSTPGIFGVDLSRKDTTRELVKQRGGEGTVWYSVNRLTRVALGASQVADYVYYLDKLGYPSAVQEVASVASFGAAV